MGSRYKIHDENGIFFVTSTIVNWIPVFVNEAYFSIMINTMKHYQDKNDLIIYAYVFMPNHFHMIISNDDISKIMQSAKKYSARKIIENLKIDCNDAILKAFREFKPEYKTTSIHQVWQESFHPKEIVSYEMLKQKIEYIHNNPVRKSLVEKPEDWEYSSAKDYYTDKKGLLDIVRLV